MKFFALPERRNGFLATHDAPCEPGLRVNPNYCFVDLSVTATEVRLVSGGSSEETAGETLTAGQTVYRKESDGRAWKADSDTGNPATADCIGICLNAATAGQPVNVATPGSIVDIGATMTLGDIIILSDTAGGLAPIADVDNTDYLCIIGVCTDVTEKYLDMAPFYFANVVHG